MEIQSVVKRLRQLRWLHRSIGIPVALFIIVTSITGVLLGWKKNVVALQPVTMDGTSKDIALWKSFQVVATNALHAMDSIGINNNTIDRMDVRPDKGIIKVLFKSGYWEVQIDGATGKVLSVAQRHSDWLEHIHDGSIINDFFKLMYTNIIGVSLFILACSGIWLWYAPKIIRKSKHKAEV